MQLADRYNWNLDTLLSYVSKNGGQVELDDDGQVVIYTDLFQRPDGSLHDTPNAPTKEPS